MEPSTLLLRCGGPLQSWGSRSRFTQRDTETEPTKSGIIGLLCAALGRDRSEAIDDLVALRMGVRVDREGIVMRDFHTAQAVRRSDPSAGIEPTVVSNRFYLSDAVFLVGMEGADIELLRRLDEALGSPRWPLFLGRKACPPADLVRLDAGVCDAEPLEQALRSCRRLAPGRGDVRGAVRMVIECAGEAEGEPRQDVPVSFQPERRAFRTRRVRTLFESIGPAAPAMRGVACG